MPQPIARLTSAGNFYVQGALDEATFDAASGFSKNFYTWSQDFRTSIPGQSIYQVYNPGQVSQWDPASAMAPDGTQTALTISNIPNVACAVSNPNGGNIGAYLEYAGGVYTKSVYAKNITGSPLIIFQFIEYANNAYATATYNLSTGVAANGTNSTAVGMYYVGNGWWRCWETITLPSIVVNPYSIGDSVFIGGYGTTSLQTTTQIWGMQFERGGLTDYEATGASSVTLPYAGTALIPQGFATRLNPTGFATIGSLDEVSINPNSGTSINLYYTTTNLNNAFWSPLHATFTSSTATAPDGTATATVVTGGTDGTTSTPYFASSETVTRGTTYTYSIYVLPGTQKYIAMLLYGTFFNNNGANPGATFNLNNGTISGTPNNLVSYGISAVGNGWYRTWITATATATGTTNGQILRFADGNVVQGGTLTVWGPQVEAGSSPTDYVPTANSKVAVPFVERKSSTGLHRISGAYDEVSLNPTAGGTNLYPYSQSFSNWAASSAVTSVVDNAATAPDGTRTATIITSTPNSNQYIYFPTVGIIKGLTYTRSIYARAGTQSTLVFEQYDTNGGPTVFNLANGTVQSTLTGDTASIVNVGNGWYRCITTRTYSQTNTNLTGTFYVGGAWGPGPGGTLYLWGAQWQLGTTATDYVATGANAIPLT